MGTLGERDRNLRMLAQGPDSAGEYETTSKDSYTNGVDAQPEPGRAVLLLPM